MIFIVTCQVDYKPSEDEEGDLEAIFESVDHFFRLGELDVEHVNIERKFP